MPARKRTGSSAVGRQRVLTTHALSLRRKAAYKVSRLKFDGLSGTALRTQSCLADGFEASPMAVTPVLSPCQPPETVNLMDRFDGPTKTCWVPSGTMVYHPVCATSVWQSKIMPVSTPPRETSVSTADRSAADTLMCLAGARTRGTTCNRAQLQRLAASAFSSAMTWQSKTRRPSRWRQKSSRAGRT